MSACSFAWKYFVNNARHSIQLLHLFLSFYEITFSRTHPFDDRCDEIEMPIPNSQRSFYCGSFITVELDLFVEVILKRLASQFNWVRWLLRCWHFQQRFRVFCFSSVPFWQPFAKSSKWIHIAKAVITNIHKMAKNFPKQISSRYAMNHNKTFKISCGDSNSLAAKKPICCSKCEVWNIVQSRSDISMKFSLKKVTHQVDKHCGKRFYWFSHVQLETN